MIRGKRVVVFTPWGRELTASILYRYLRRDHFAGVVDEWHLWMNTDPDQHADREYGYRLERGNDWIKTFERPEGPVLKPKQMNTGRFYVYTQDPDTIYVRMDDDIVWIEENAIARLVEQRIDNPFPFIVFPIIWNNSVVTHYLQKSGRFPMDWGEVGNHCMDPLGWGNSGFAFFMHRLLLNTIEDGDVEDFFMHTSVQLPIGQQFSVSCFAQFGSEYAKVEGNLGGEEEGWHSINKPYELQRPNLIVPNSLISHFSFYHQREFLLNTTDILGRYKELAQDL